MAISSEKAVGTRSHSLSEVCLYHRRSFDCVGRQPLCSHALIRGHDERSKVLKLGSEVVALDDHLFGASGEVDLVRRPVQLLILTQVSELRDFDAFQGRHVGKHVKEIAPEVPAITDLAWPPLVGQLHVHIFDFNDLERGTIVFKQALKDARAPDGALRKLQFVDREVGGNPFTDADSDIAVHMQQVPDILEDHANILKAQGLVVRRIVDCVAQIGGDSGGGIDGEVAVDVAVVGGRIGGDVAVMGRPYCSLVLCETPQDILGSSREEAEFSDSRDADVRDFVVSFECLPMQLVGQATAMRAQVIAGGLALYVLQSYLVPTSLDGAEDLVETEFFMHEKEIGLPVLSAVVVWNRFQYQPFDGRSEIIVSEEVE